MGYNGLDRVRLGFIRLEWIRLGQSGSQLVKIG